MKTPPVFPAFAKHIYPNCNRFHVSSNFLELNRKLYLKKKKISIKFANEYAYPFPWNFHGMKSDYKME